MPRRKPTRRKATKRKPRKSLYEHKLYVNAVPVDDEAVRRIVEKALEQKLRGIVSYGIVVDIVRNALGRFREWLQTEEIQGAIRDADPNREQGVWAKFIRTLKWMLVQGLDFIDWCLTHPLVILMTLRLVLLVITHYCRRLRSPNSKTKEIISDVNKAAIYFALDELSRDSMDNLGYKKYGIQMAKVVLTMDDWSFESLFKAILFETVLVTFRYLLESVDVMRQIITVVNEVCLHGNQLRPSGYRRQQRPPDEPFDDPMKRHPSYVNPPRYGRSLTTPEFVKLSTPRITDVKPLF